mgnify:FL=1
MSNGSFKTYEEFEEWFDCMFDFCFILDEKSYYVGYYTQSKRLDRKTGWYLETLDNKPLVFAETHEKLFEIPYFDGKSFKEKICEVKLID